MKFIGNDPNIKTKTKQINSNKKHIFFFRTQQLESTCHISKGSREFDLQLLLIQQWKHLGFEWSQIKTLYRTQQSHQTWKSIACSWYLVGKISISNTYFYAFFYSQFIIFSFLKITGNNLTRSFPTSKCFSFHPSHFRATQ